MVKILAVSVFVLAIFSLISCLSFLFTWKIDQSILSEDTMMDQAVEASNNGGKLGFIWGRFLIANAFGLASFGLVGLMFWGGWKLFFKNSETRHPWRTIILSLVGIFLTSLLLTYMSELFTADAYLEGGLGGFTGIAVVDWAKNLIGSFPTLLLILFCFLLWGIFFSPKVAQWLDKASNYDFSKKKEARAKSAALAAVEAEEAAAAAAQDTEEEDTVAPVPASGSDLQPEAVTAQDPMDQLDALDDLDPESSGSGASSDDLPVDLGDEAFVAPAGQASSPAALPDDRSVPAGPAAPAAGEGADGAMDIITGDKFSTDVKEELPPLNVRSDLDKYQFPSLDLLNDYADGYHEVSQEELESNNNKIRTTLLNYRIKIDKVTAIPGPTVTLYKIIPAPGVKIASIRNVEEDIAISLKARGVRVVKLEDAVGIEVANKLPSIVPLKAMLNDESFRNSKAELPVAIGYTITQKVKTFDLADAPHLLIAGATKQGKSVGLNVIISSLLYRKHPSELKLVFIDPKMVEFSAYKALLHHYLAVLPTAANAEEEAENAIIKQPKQADLVLNSLCVEMDERYLLLSKGGVNNIKLYNEKYKARRLNPNDGHRFLPYIVVVIDEYADLTMSGGPGGDAKAIARNVTNSIVRLAQKGRAAGIHVIIATQRPTVNVVTGLIKTNFPTRIAFRVVSRTDSMTILDSNGAENLIGKGDMLYYAGVEMERVQCALVSMDEINKITKYIGSQNGYHQCYTTPYYLPMPDTGDNESAPGSIDMSSVDPLFEDAARMVVMNQKGSTSDLQRRLGIGYAKAGRIMDQLEAAGVVGPQEGSKPRQVMCTTFDELDELIAPFLK